MDIYGEKYSGDSKFVADCRQLQSMYRVEVNETIRPYKGRDGKTHYYGNYISDGEKSGNNFLTNYAFRYATERVTNKKEYETIEQDRLFNNLLSSQPMAFNLFCPLREMLEKSPEAATAAIKAALPMYPIHSVTDVDLEFIPEDYAELSGDKSAMDAIIRFVDDSGQKGFIAIETKYSENLGTNVALEKGTNKPRAKSLETVRRLKCFKPDIFHKHFNPEVYDNLKASMYDVNSLSKLLSDKYGSWLRKEAHKGPYKMSYLVINLLYRYNKQLGIDGIPYLGDYRRLDKLPVLNFEPHKVEHTYAYNLIRDLEKLNDGIALSDLYHLIDVSLPFTKDDLPEARAIQ